MLSSSINKGYTYIELLIVMMLIGALAGLFITSYPATQERARDTKRKSDLKQYQIGLETYGNRNNGLYYTQSTAVQASTTLCTGIGFGSGDCPTDPKDGANSCSGNQCRYFYQSNAPGTCAAGTACATSYVLWARIERPESASNPYFLVCSNGESGMGASIPVSPGVCPL